MSVMPSPPQIGRTRGSRVRIEVEFMVGIAARILVGIVISVAVCVALVVALCVDLFATEAHT